MEILISSSELKARRLGCAKLKLAAQSVREEGYVILANAVNRDHLDVLRPRMHSDSLRLISMRKWGGAGRLEGHLQQGPPPFAPFVFRDVVANPFAMQVTHSLLGDGMYNRFYNGNTNCPQSQRQPLHVDAAPLWPISKVPHPPASLVVNIALTDVNVGNGSTELWPGTHLITSDKQRISVEAEAKRRLVMPPVRADTAKGSLLIRDARLWHRGMPNPSDEIRHMIAMIHNIHWLQRPQELLFDFRCQDQFPEDSRLDHNAQFTDRQIFYLFSRFPTLEADVS